jgi:hypothetical protein
MTPRAVNVAVVTADPGLQVQTDAAIEIRGLPAFKLEVVDTVDPVPVGGRTSYKISVTNQGSLPGNQVQIVATVPPQVRVINANGPSQPRFEGQRVIFPAVDGLQPKQVFSYSVDVEALQAGDARFHVELRSTTLTEPVIEEESTTVFVPVPGAGQPVPAPPGSNVPASPPGAGAPVPAVPGSPAPVNPAPGATQPTSPPPTNMPAPMPAGPAKPP